MLRLVNLDVQLRGKLQRMPPLETGKLWPIQIKAIKFADACRVLILVDRNNLGTQTYNEFEQYVSPYTNYRFTEEFNVQHLRRNTIDPASRVCITTILRLYSMLKGEEELDEEAEEGSLFESEMSWIKEPLPVVYNARIPIGLFDFIIVDECHRSIYNVWRQVLEYFDAFIIGLTATPTAQAIGFFKGNLVQEYTHEDAVADGVNVGYDVYRIATKITEQGATLEKKPGSFLTGIFSGRTEVRKTLVFAKNDQHADDVVKIIREEFVKGDDFCQKITSKPKDGDTRASLGHSLPPLPTLRR